MGLFQHERRILARARREEDLRALEGIDRHPVRRRVVPRPVARSAHVPKDGPQLLGHYGATRVVVPTLAGRAMARSRAAGGDPS